MWRWASALPCSRSSELPLRLQSRRPHSPRGRCPPSESSFGTFCRPYDRTGSPCTRTSRSVYRTLRSCTRAGTSPLSRHLHARMSTHRSRSLGTCTSCNAPGESLGRRTTGTFHVPRRLRRLKCRSARRAPSWVRPHRKIRTPCTCTSSSGSQQIPPHRKTRTSHSHCHRVRWPRKAAPVSRTRKLYTCSASSDHGSSLPCTMARTCAHWNRPRTSSCRSRTGTLCTCTASSGRSIRSRRRMAGNPDKPHHSLHASCRPPSVCLAARGQRST